MKTPCRNCICPEYKRYKKELEKMKEYIKKGMEEYQAQQRPVLKKI